MDTLSQVCVWTVVASGILTIGSVSAVAIASAVHLVKKLFPKPGVLWEPVPVPAPAAPIQMQSSVPVTMLPVCKCGLSLGSPSKSEVVDGKPVLVYVCSCKRITRV